MLVVPFAFDQPDNAARAVKLGVARSLRIGRYTASRVTRELENAAARRFVCQERGVGG